jgi:hypothetical protein
MSQWNLSIRSIASWAIVLFLLGCAGPAGSGRTALPSSSGASVEAEAEARPPAVAGAQTEDAPEISRSAGVEGGIVVFWPRVIPKSDAPEIRAIAASLQERVRAMVAEALPGRPIDVRPEPERVCPMAGCEAMTVGILLLHEADGCAALALVSPPGASPTTIVPWAGDVRLHATVASFRDPPESHVTVEDFVPCSALLSSLDDHKEPVIEEMRAKAR